MLLDGNGLIYRGYFALPPLTTSKGELVNAVFGFCSIVLRGIAGHPPGLRRGRLRPPGSDLPPRAVRRVQGDPPAHAGRPARPVPEGPRGGQGAAHPRLRAGGLRGRRRHRHDHRATPSARGLDTTIVTGDLDMLQLVTDHTRLMTTRSGVENTILYDPARIAERFDLVPGQMIDYKALKGDPTDNIPGVPGVGEKTAAKLIREFGTLEALYERIDEVKPDKLRDKLVEHRDAVFMGKDLSTIVRDLPVDFDLEAARLGDYDRETVIRLFREYEFRSLIERLPAMTGEIGRGRGRSAPWGRDRRLRAGRPRRRCGATVRLGLGAPGPATVRGRRAPAVARLRCRGRDGVARWRRVSRAGAGDAAARPTAIEAGDLPTALAAAIADPSRIEVHAGSTGSRRSNRGSPRRPRSASGSCSTTRVRDAASRWRWPSPGRMAGRSRSRARTTPRRCAGCSTGWRPRSSATRSSHCWSPRIADDPDAPADAGRVRYPDRRLRAQCRPAQPDHRRRRGRAARPDPAARRRARQRGPGRPGGAVRDRRPRAARAASRRGRPRPAVPRARAAAHRGAGPDGGDRRRPRPRGARRPGPGVRDRDLAARDRRSTPTSATSSTSAAPSSSSRSCSSS